MREATRSDRLHAIESRYAVDEAASDEQFLAAAKLYAREIVARFGLSVSVSALSWAVSTRAKRRAGAVKHREGSPETVSLTRQYFETKGWSSMAAIVRHELIHVHLLNEMDDGGHGEQFHALAEELHAPRHCERFAEPSWWVVCTGCPTRIPRYRRSKLVTHPEEYACGNCGGGFRVETTDTRTES